METTPLALLGVGLLLGVRHALDADHVVAVSTIVSRSRRLRDAAAIGMFWGLGHTLTLLAAATAVLVFRWTLPEALALSFELAVGVLLIGLGIGTVWGFRRRKVHVHRHDHGDGPHLHFHSHRAAPSHAHEHTRPTAVRSLAIGLVHGLAGSAALILLALSSVASPWVGLLLVGVFGVGSIVGMMGVTLLIGLPLVLAGQRLGAAQQTIGVTAGLASVAVGIFIVGEVGPTLFTRL